MQNGRVFFCALLHLFLERFKIWGIALRYFLLCNELNLLFVNLIKSTKKPRIIDEVEIIRYLNYVNDHSGKL